MKNKILMTVCSSYTIEGLTGLINKFYYSENYIVTEDHKVFNTKTEKTLGEVKEKKGRFYYYPY